MPEWTPYRFGFNNPVYFSDPTGLFERIDNIYAWPMERGTEKGQVHEDQDGKFIWDGVSWRDSNNAPVAYGERTINEVIMSSKSQSSITSYHDWSQTFRKSSGYAFSANKILFQPAFERATLYDAPKIYTTTTLIYEKSLPKILGGRRIIYQPLMTMNAIKAGKIAKGLKVAGTSLALVGIGVAGYDIAKNGTNMSNSLDLTMSILAVSPTGWGASYCWRLFSY
ncbi:hypothetical protein [Elizabethkingia anophelis]|uniref:hypothetical protein n=1 Tax=Elizabethkingia anophelis TaxID=1117645 RepID=UPI003891A264